MSGEGGWGGFEEPMVDVDVWTPPPPLHFPFPSFNTLAEVCLVGGRQWSGLEIFHLFR